MRSLRAPRRPVERRAFRDPAPSRWRYRYQRLMLTPLFRKGLIVGLPVLAVVAALGGWLAQAENRALVAQRVAALAAQIQSRPEFQVTELDIEGADIALAAAISNVLREQGVRLPVSSFDLDLNAIRAGVVDLTAVRSAVVRVRPGGTLAVEVEQRQPVAVWRHIDGLRLLDADGVMTGMILARTDRPELPILAGDGAREATAEAMALFAAAEPLAPRVRGLVRMGERRWDLVLDRDQRILLPEDGPVAALERLIALDDAQPVLERDVAAVDLRNPQRITVRAGPMSAAALQTAYEQQ